MLRSILFVALMGCTAAQTGIRKQPPEDFNSEFLYWCEQEGQWPVFAAPPPDCEKVSRGTWDRLPITVNAADDLQKETMEAIDAFNESVGFELFRYEHTNMYPDIAAVPWGENVWAIAQAMQFTDDLGNHRGLVKVFNGYEHEDRADIIMHELGHLVGLRHDPDNFASIMYPTLASRVARLEQADIRALRFIYRK